MDEIKVGDRFLVEVEIQRIAKNGDIHIFVPVDALANWVIPVPTNIILAAKRLPRALKVGDRVRVHYGAPVTIKAIDGSDAWVMTEDGGRFTTELNFLTPAEESAS